MVGYTVTGYLLTWLCQCSTTLLLATGKVLCQMNVSQ